ncbi:MAG: DNA recombination protein RmuC [Opitutae bacterium]
MDTLIPILLGLLILGVGALIYLYSTQKNSGATSVNQDLLVQDLRAQIKALQVSLQIEQDLKTKALQRVSAAEAIAESSKSQLAEAQSSNAINLAQTRADSEKQIAELKVAFSKMSNDVLKGMAPDVTKEVATKVAPLISEVTAALENYRRSMQQSILGQDQAIAAVNAQMSQMAEATKLLSSSTNDFTAVLKSSQHRGKWGEQTLRNVVDSAGMSSLCDYSEQVSTDDTRPDLIVRIPVNRCVIIDSKVPEFDVALANQSAPNRKELVEDHAKKLLKTIKDLAAKDYASKKQNGLQPFEKVVLFLPAESLLSTALEGDNNLILKANEQNILIATPATLLGFLSAINLTWQQHKQSENASNIAAAAKDLYESVETFIGHFNRARNGLHSASENFNKAIGSYNTIRKKGDHLRALGAAEGRDSFEPIADVNTDIRRIEGSAD